VTTFAKYQGLGNDFVVIDAKGPLAPEIVARVCDRHFGVGADGVLVVTPPRSVGSVASMIVQNADGSRPEMCGNGLRCVAVHLAAKHGGAASIVVDTDAGPRGCEVSGDEVRIDMGVAREEDEIEVGVFDRTLPLSRVDMGNPHAITFDDLGDDALAHFGPRVATHPAFPQGTNFEIAKMRADGGIDVLVWERGVGPTLACGTGACAVAVRACRLGLVPYGVEVAVHLPGGALAITVDASLRVSMRGPAHRVFVGEGSW
jgi:diaminopimelate epimerase